MNRIGRYLPDDYGQGHSDPGMNLVLLLCGIIFVGLILIILAGAGH